MKFKKSQTKSFLVLAIIIIFVGIFILAYQLFSDKGLTGLAKQVPDLLNSILKEVEKRSPSSNVLYIYSDIHEAYNLKSDKTGICKYELKNANKKMADGYILINQTGNRLNISLIQENNPLDINPSALTQEDVKLCVIQGINANYLQKQINRIYLGKININFYIPSPEKSTIKILLGDKGFKQIQFDNEALELSNYMIFDRDNNMMCFLPMNNYGTCDFREGFITTRCVERFDKIKNC